MVESVAVRTIHTFIMCVREHCAKNPRCLDSVHIHAIIFGRLNPLMHKVAKMVT